jgi:hypothetical protein
VVRRLFWLSAKEVLDYVGKLFLPTAGLQVVLVAALGLQVEQEALRWLLGSGRLGRRR